MRYGGINVPNLHIFDVRSEVGVRIQSRLTADRSARRRRRLFFIRQDRRRERGAI